MLLNLTKAKSYDLVERLGHPSFLKPLDRTVSRLRFKPDFFNFIQAAERIEELFDPSIRRLDFAACCFLRAQELLELDRENYYVSWSGGIDSTCALVAILQTWSPADLKRIRLILTSSSIEENPSFFAKHLAHFPLFNATLDASHHLVNQNAVLVTGELGDQLFGSDLVINSLRTLGDDLFNQDYEKVLPQILDNYTFIPGAGKIILEHFRPIVDESPFPLRSAHDFLWWWNFSQKWQHVKYRFVELKTWDLRARYGTSVQHFFDSKEFQRWSLENHEKKIKGTWASYKFTAKEFIHAFTRNETDLHLRKVQSLKGIYALSEKRLAVDENYREIETLEELMSYARTDL